MAKHMHKLCDKSSGSQTFPQDIYDRKFTGDADVDPIGGRKRPGSIALSREGHGRPTLGLGRYLYYIMFKQPAMPRPQAFPWTCIGLCHFASAPRIFGSCNVLTSESFATKL